MGRCLIVISQRINIMRPIRVIRAIRGQSSLPNAHDDRSVAAVCGMGGGGGGGAGATFAVVTVEIACLKINCSWLFASRMTEYLSNPLIFPINFTPLMRKTVTGSFSRRTVLR